jgi:putative sterol carrier protein
MDLAKMTAKLSEAKAYISGKRLKIDYSDEGVLVLDGVAEQVTNDPNVPADTTITIGWADWLALASGELDPVSAYMQGKLRVDGDMGLAMQMQGLLSRIRG